MGQLMRSTRRADTAVEECTCYHDCAADAATACHASGDWHAHDDEPCARHPQRIVSRA
jgi:hypothetical protein